MARPSTTAPPVRRRAGLADVHRARSLLDRGPARNEADRRTRAPSRVADVRRGRDGNASCDARRIGGESS